MKPKLMVFVGILTVFLAAFSASCAEDDKPKIIVQGDGNVIAPADRVTVVLGVETRDASAARAVSENARLMNETIAELLEAGISESEIQTSKYSLSTSQQDQLFDSEEVVDNPQFIATNMVTFVLNNTTAVGEILDRAVSSGSNSIQEISFDLIDPKPQQDLALSQAIEDGRRKAEIAARAAGVTLGRILEISEGYGYVSASSKRAFFDVSTPIQSGNMEVTASVTMTYEIS